MTGQDYKRKKKKRKWIKKWKYEEKLVGKNGKKTGIPMKNKWKTDPNSVLPFTGN